MAARSFRLAVLLPVALVACEPLAEPPGEVRAPLIDGTPSTGDPAVVAIVSTAAPTKVKCTGTLIAERVVLTAAHCAVQADAASFAVFFGNDARAGGKLVKLIEARAHPQYDETATHDLALLLLAEAPPTAPVPLLSESIFSGAAAVPVRLVGFGVTAADGDPDGIKREGRSRTSEVASEFLTLAADPSLPCRGDSGGPVFATSGGERLAAVVSRGDPGCATYAKATRVDVHLDTFIAPYVAATAPGSATLGKACLYDAQCASGVCVTALDEPMLRYCSAPCRNVGDCAAPLACAEGECRYPLPTPGAVGARCGRNSDCVRGECLDDGTCSVRCVSSSQCPTDYVCKHLGGVDFFCKPGPSLYPARAGGGGCAAGGPQRPFAAGALLFAALLLARVIRRR